VRLVTTRRAGGRWSGRARPGYQRALVLVGHPIQSIQQHDVPTLIEQGGEKSAGSVLPAAPQVVIDKRGQLALSGIGMVRKAATVVSMRLSGT
jgi:hypothetical protein